MALFTQFEQTVCLFLYQGELIRAWAELKNKTVVLLECCESALVLGKGSVCSVAWCGPMTAV